MSSTATTTTIHDLPDLCLRKIFAYLPLSELLRLDQCYLPWLPLQGSVCKSRRRVTIILGRWKVDSPYYDEYSMRSFNDGIPHVSDLDPLVIRQHRSVLQSSPRLDELDDSLAYEWLYERDSRRIPSMMPNISRLTIVVADLSCYRYIGEHSRNNRLSLMPLIVKLINHWAPQLTKLCITLSIDNFRATLVEVSEDWRLLIKSLNSMPKLRQLALSLDESFFDPSDDRIWNDETKLTNLFYHQLNFMPKLTNLYLNVNNSMFHSMFASELTNSIANQGSLEALVLSGLEEIDPRLDGIFDQIGPKVVLLPRLPLMTDTIAPIASKLTNLCSVTIQMGFCVNQNSLARALRPLSRLKQLIHLELRIDSHMDNIGAIQSTEEEEVATHLDTVRILSLKTYLDEEQREHLSEGIDWNVLLPSLAVVTIDNDDVMNELVCDQGRAQDEASVPLCDSNRKESSNGQLCVCERWALRMFANSLHNLNVLYTKHRKLGTTRWWL